MEVNEHIADCLAEQGYAVINNYFSDLFCKALREEQEILFEEGAFRAAGIGRGQDFKLAPEIRGDKVLWLHEANLTELQKKYWEQITVLREYLNEALFISVNGFEAHYAVYPPASFYKSHLDQHAKTRHRIISCILYLNPDWQPKDEGMLRIYNPDGSFALDVAPVIGTFVCFRSADIPHEVLPTNSDRYSITGWMRNDSFML